MKEGKKEERKGNKLFIPSLGSNHCPSEYESSA